MRSLSLYTDEKTLCMGRDKENEKRFLHMYIYPSAAIASTHAILDPYPNADMSKRL